MNHTAKTLCIAIVSGLLAACAGQGANTITDNAATTVAAGDQMVQGGQGALSEGQSEAQEVATKAERKLDTPPVPIPNARTPLPGLLTGGQPSASDLQLAAQAGYKTVISLRTEGEAGSEGEKQAAEAAGLKFVSIPVKGAEGLTEDNAKALGAALQAGSEAPIILHCGTGNRAGALLALKAYFVDGMAAEDALALGKAAGMTSLTAAVTAKMH